MRGSNYMNHKIMRRCLSALISGMLIASCGSAALPLSGNAAGNLIKNSTFENGTKDWGTYKESGGSCALSTDDGRLALTVKNVGKVNYAVQVYYDIIPLYKNGVYRLKYDISSTVDRFVEGMIQMNGGDYRAYTWKGLNLTSTPQTVEYEFTMEEETDIMAKLVFNCGIQEKYEGELPEHTIYIDNVSLELVDDSNVDYDADKPYAPSININQVGYRTDSKKTAVFRDVTNQTEFSVVNADTKEKVFTGKLENKKENASAGETNYTGDFSSVTKAGKYYISCDGLDDSYTFEIGDKVYSNLIDDSVKMLYLQRCGVKVEDATFGHAACHTSQATVYGTNQKIDVSGGWHDAGDYGRYVVPAAKTVADLLYAYQAAPSLYSDSLGIPESGNGVPDILDEARFELEWMMKMQAPDGGAYHKVSCATFPGYVAPTEEKDELIVTPVSSTATADFCASMALAAEFYEKYDSDFAKKCMEAANKSWAWLESDPNFLFKNPEDIVTGEYGDMTDKDERYWAAVQMYRATKDDKHLASAGKSYTGLDWSTVGDYGNIAILTMNGADKNSDVYKNAQAAVLKQADKMIGNVESSPYGSPLTKYNWGSNMTIANAGIIFGLAQQLTGGENYGEAAQAQLNYLLGANPVATCFVSGYGTVSPENPHHRPSMAAGKAMKGMLAGGVNENLEDSAAKAYLADAPAAKCYVDNSESYSTNEITIYWNSPLTYLLTLTDPSVAPAPVQPATEAPTEPATEAPTTEPATEPATTAPATEAPTTEPVTTAPATEAPTQPANVKYGDANLDGDVTLSDALLILQYVANSQKYNIDGQGLVNADCFNPGDGITGQDALSIQKLDAKVIASLPDRA